MDLNKITFTNPQTICSHYSHKKNQKGKKLVFLKRRMRGCCCQLRNDVCNTDYEIKANPTQPVKIRVPPPPPIYCAPSHKKVLEYAARCEKMQGKSRETITSLAILNYSRRTTIHCVAHLAHARNNRGRFFWCLIMLAAIIGFGKNMSRIIENYLKTPILTNIYHDSKYFTFPDITFCNLNPLYFPPNGTKEYENMRQHIRNHSEFAPEIALTDYLFQKKFIVGHPSWSFIMKCSFQGELCDHNNFKMNYIWPYGRCYTFNPDSTHSGRSLSLGIVYGGRRPHFEILMYKGLDVPKEFENILDPHNEISMPSGIMLIIHEEGTYPNLFQSNLFDQFTMLDLRIAQKTHLPYQRHFINNDQISQEPESMMPCLNETENYLYYNYALRNSSWFNGREQDCIFSIMREVLKKYAKCKIDYMPITEGEKDLDNCFNKDKQEGLREAFKNIDKDSLRKCYRYRCVRSVYTKVISQAKFPSVETRRSELLWLEKLKLLEETETSVYEGKSDLQKYALKTAEMNISQAYKNKRIDLLNRDFVERNFAMFRLQPASFYMDQIVETLEYPEERLLSDIGGCVGLWLGASLVTIFELLDLVLEYLEIKRWFNRREKIRKVQIPRDEIQEQYESTLDTQQKNQKISFDNIFPQRNIDPQQTGHTTKNLIPVYIHAK